MRLANKTALITGGNSGIGLATAKLFVAEGAGSSSPGATRRRWKPPPRNWGRTRSRSWPTPPTSPRPKPRSRQAAEKFGKLDIVFANAGIAGGTPLGGATLEAFEKVISTNLTGVFFTVQSALPHLNDNASIILNGSVISVLGNPGYSAYGASKAGVRAMARIMASELSPRGIRVNVVAPGAIRTPIWGAAIATPEAEKAFEKRIGAIDAARPHRRTRPHFEDGPVPRLGRCRACAGPGIVRRRRRHGVSERCADLSGIRRGRSNFEAGRRF